MKIYSYNPGSKSAKDLAEALGIKRIKHQGSKFKPSPRHTIINWGSGNLPNDLLLCNILNNPDKVALATNKLKFFNHLEDSDVKIPEFTSSPDVVRDSLSGKDNVEWLARTKLQGHSGEGIEVIRGNDDELPVAPLYVRYVKKKDEFRVHVFKDEVVDVQRKARNKDVPDEEVNWQIRNHHNGFIFARNEGKPVPEQVSIQALKAVKEVGLDFGAVDIIYNEREEEAYVLEINTAPGLAGTTLEGYVQRLKDYDNVR